MTKIRTASATAARTMTLPLFICGCRDILRDNPSKRTSSMPVNKSTPVLALCLLLGTAAAHANIVKLEITRVEPAGPTHERVTGKAYGELDPADPKNAVITDIELAPRNARGKVEYVTTFTLVRPTEMMRGSGVLVYTVVNRGGGNAMPHPDGHVTFVSGWQGAVVPTSTNQTIQVPVA